MTRNQIPITRQLIGTRGYTETVLVDAPQEQCTHHGGTAVIKHTKEEIEKCIKQMDDAKSAAGMLREADSIDADTADESHQATEQTGMDSRRAEV